MYGMQLAECERLSAAVVVVRGLVKHSGATLKPRHRLPLAASRWVLQQSA